MNLKTKLHRDSFMYLLISTLFTLLTSSCCQRSPLTNSQNMYQKSTLSKFLKVKLQEERPSGTQVVNIAQFLLSEIGSNPWLNVTNFHIVSTSPSVNRLFRLNKDTGELVSNVIIDRDWLCSRDRLCCATQNSNANYAFQKSTTNVHTFPSNFEHLNKAVYLKTLDHCLIKFRIVYDVFQYSNETNNQMESYTGYLTFEIEILDINDNTPQFLISTTPSTNSGTKFTPLILNPIPIVELSILENAQIQSCYPLPMAFDLDSTRYGISEYRIGPLSSTDLGIIQQKLRTFNSSMLKLNNELPFVLQQSPCSRNDLPSEFSSYPGLVPTEIESTGMNQPVTLHPMLQLINQLDREKNDLFCLKLLAIDGLKEFEPTQTRLNMALNDKSASGKRFLKHTSSILVCIQIADVNDNDPIVPRQLNFEIPENIKSGQVIGQINATDPDTGLNGRLNFHIQTDPTGQFSTNIPFSVNSHNGLISVSRPLDADRLGPETSRTIHFQIVTSDSGHPTPNSAYTNVNVHILDVNDETPQIKVIDLESRSNPPYPTILENKPPGQLVAFVSATDADSGPNGLLACRLDNPNFKLEQLTPTDNLLDTQINGFGETNGDLFYGFKPNPQAVTFDYQLITDVSLDRESNSVEYVEIVCVDQPYDASMIRTGRTRFAVFVLDENDNAPMFSTQQIYIDIMENTGVEEMIYVFNATDPDMMVTNYLDGTTQQAQFYSNAFQSQQPSKVKYQIDDKASQYFRIDENAGLLYTKSVIDGKQWTEMIFNVTALDTGIPSRNASAQVYVRVLDQNDHAPQFEQGTYYLNVSENVPIGFKVTRLLAHDEDRGKNAEIMYTMDDIQGNSQKVFRLDSENGTLWVSGMLDREKQDLYIFKIQASDKGIPRQSSSTFVQIKILDVNDNAPKFVYPTAKNHTIHASVHTTPGIPLVKLTAVDADTEFNAHLTFLLNGDTAAKHVFMVDELSGEVSLLPSADPNAIGGRYKLELEVRDSGDPPLSGHAVVNVVLDQTTSKLPDSDKFSLTRAKQHDTRYRKLRTYNTNHSNNDQYEHSVSDSIPMLSDNKKSSLKSSADTIQHAQLIPITARSHQWQSLANNKPDSSGQKVSLEKSKSNAYLSLEKVWIIVICMIAMCIIVAFAFLVAVTLVRQKSVSFDFRRRQASVNIPTDQNTLQKPRSFHPVHNQEPILYPIAPTVSPNKGNYGPGICLPLLDYELLKKDAHDPHQSDSSTLDKSEHTKSSFTKLDKPMNSLQRHETTSPFVYVRPEDLTHLDRMQSPNLVNPTFLSQNISIQNPPLGSTDCSDYRYRTIDLRNSNLSGRKMIPSMDGGQHGQRYETIHLNSPNGDGIKSMGCLHKVGGYQMLDVTHEPLYDAFSNLNNSNQLRLFHLDPKCLQVPKSPDLAQDFPKPSGSLNKFNPQHHHSTKSNLPEQLCSENGTTFGSDCHPLNNDHNLNNNNNINSGHDRKETCLSSFIPSSSFI